MASPLSLHSVSAVWRCPFAFGLQPERPYRRFTVCSSALLRDLSTGQTLTLEGTVTLGKDKSNTIQLVGDNIADQHAILQKKGGRVFCTALAGKPGDFMADTFTWLQADTQLRGGVDYLLSPGAELSFGVPGQNSWRVEFEETGGSAMADMLMKSMAQGATDEVRKVLDQRG